jgi:hypothetical protein
LEVYNQNSVDETNINLISFIALEQYQFTNDHKPQTSKHGIRFPYRNRFISQYIYDKTGKTRTHKQVGSRLQQLRDTCEDSRSTPTPFSVSQSPLTFMPSFLEDPVRTLKTSASKTPRLSLAFKPKP